MQTMQSREIVADLMRRPANPENLAIETLLVYAGAELQAGRFNQSEEVLDAVNMVLDAYLQNENQPFEVHWLADDYLQIVLALIEQGLVPQYIEVNGNIAYVRVNARNSSPELLLMAREQGRWYLIY